MRKYELILIEHDRQESLGLVTNPIFEYGVLRATKVGRIVEHNLSTNKYKIENCQPQEIVIGRTPFILKEFNN